MATQKKVFEDFETVFSQTPRNPESIAQSLVSMCDELKDATGGGGSGSVTAADVAYNNTVSGLSATNVQNAIDEVVVGKADKTDLTSISQTGSTATQTIPSGTYFYLNGSLVRAKTNIASGATFVSGTNYESGDNALNATSNGGSVSVTGNGSKNITTLMQELIALADTSKININSYVLYANSLLYRSANIGTGDYRFVCFGISEYEMLRVNDGVGSYITFNMANGTYNPSNNFVVGNGVKLELFY